MVCITGENERPFRSMANGNFGRSRTPISVDAEQPGQLKQIRSGNAWVDPVTSWKAETARSLLVGASNFSEGGLRAIEENIGATDHGSPAPGRAGTQLPSDWPERRHQRVHHSGLPHTGPECWP